MPQNAAPQAVCIFCTSLFLIPELANSYLARSTILTTRRQLNTSRGPYNQSAAAAQARSEPSNGNASHHSQGTWDPTSTLTAAERAAKEQRLAAQLERARQEEERQQRQWRAQKAERQRERDARRKADVERENKHRDEMTRNEEAARRNRSQQAESRSVFGGERVQQVTRRDLKTSRPGQQGGGRRVPPEVSKPAFGARPRRRLPE